MNEVKWFKSEKERLAYIRGQYEEFKPKVVKEEKVKKKGRKNSEIQAD